MPRALFEKTGNAVWISHLDLMRVFQRAFKRAGLPLTHTNGFNPRPSVSIALPMSVGIESCCELLDFELEGASVPGEEILSRLNEKLIRGVRVKDIYDNGQKLRNLALMDCALELEYDNGIPDGACEGLKALLSRESLCVEKKGKNGVIQQDIIPMIRRMDIREADGHSVCITARICCQNPTLNPMQIYSAVEAYCPELRADNVSFRRLELYDTQENIFR